MRGIKSNDRRRRDEECFRSQSEVMSHTPKITLLSDDHRKSPCDDDRTWRVMPVVPSLPPLPLFMARTSTSRTTSDSAVRRISSTSASGALLSFRSTASSPFAPSLPFMARGAVVTPSTSARTGFSVGTVVALSTVLPTIILLLLGIIIHLIRTRNRPRPEGSPKDLEGNFPMADIRHPEHSLDVLQHRSFSPFDLSFPNLVFGRSANSSKPETTSVRSHVSSDSGHAESSVHANQPTVPPIAITRAPDLDPPPTPVLAVRYPSRFITGSSKPGDRNSIYMDCTSVDSGSATPSTVVFAHPAPTEAGSSVGRPSREVPVERLSIGTDHTGKYDFAHNRRASREHSPITAGPSSGRTGAAETLTTDRDMGSGSKKLKLPGIAPPTRAHARSQSQPTTTYSLPSLQLSPRAHTRHTPAESHVRSPLRPSPVQESPSPSWPQRIYSHRVSASLSTPIRTSSTLSQASPPPPGPLSSNQDRLPLSIVVPPRLGAPIIPIAELAALQTPPTSPQQTPRVNTPRTAGPRTPGSALSIQETLGLTRPRGMSDVVEPDAETRERILRLLGRLPEEPSSGDSGSREGDERRSRDVRRTRSEGGLHGTLHETT
ncbi:transmembrane protein, putative [Rhizoctonia solani AG-3 Rhs1AP]|uniref:Transmembrane protein, putative n=1 Tax=Rhizoctonia solani AG-3 Rhs1AP TaxID=1086054 RepID=A0A0A1UHI2_9AGAM|nr:transmembrane protein, putative [Rhizoctonia solani AG-3 Rhs1AP]